MERSEQFHPSKPCVRRRAQPISPVAAAQPTHITAATAETATAYLFVNRVPSLGCSCRIQATRKEGVGAVQLQLLPDRGVAGDLHLLLHQDAVPGNPQRPHRIPWFLLESCQDRSKFKVLVLQHIDGERLSPWVSVGCLAMGISTIFF
ncbi:uncharacterized protein [Zea mays]|uniref:uncharacterized protein isoform X2 n=2 Tax=Zea mays TaxID=4577 RepID=UPI0004DEB8C4|nr:uncharacterized protein LOC100275296 isoform X2 [Zea mays]|eukprot:XP_008649453.1 uncharacterized protein LOC100275296 isoform X1 [Zea mays]